MIPFTIFFQAYRAGTEVFKDKTLLFDSPFQDSIAIHSPMCNPVNMNGTTLLEGEIKDLASDLEPAIITVKVLNFIVR